MTSLAADHMMLTRKVAAVRLERDVIRVFGSDAQSFLQSQITQDISTLGPGAHCFSFLLDPSGHVVALVRLWGRLGDSEILLDVEAGCGEAVVERLNRFRLRVKAEIELLGWDYIALRGPECPPLDSPLLQAELIAGVNWAGVRGVDLLSPGLSVPDEFLEIEPDALELLRIEAGWPASGHEFGSGSGSKVMPAEAGDWLIENTVSFTKGCYTGQELVTRIHSRGNNTPRRLCGIQSDDEQLPEVGAEVIVDGQVRGRLTSVSPEAESSGSVGLGYVHRSVVTPSDALLRWTPEDGATLQEVEVRIRQLPQFER